jgi:hypothetical protein
MIPKTGVMHHAEKQTRLAKARIPKMSVRYTIIPKVAFSTKIIIPQGELR